MARHFKAGASDRRPTPEEATRNIDPRVAKAPEQWSRDDFLRDLKRATRPDPDEESEKA